MPLVIESTLVDHDEHTLEQQLRLQAQPQLQLQERVEVATAEQAVAATLVRCVSSAQLRWPPPRRPKA